MKRIRTDEQRRKHAAEEQARRDRDRSAYNAYMQKWKEKNLSHYRDYTLRRKFGIGLDEYTTMLELQGGRCAICSRTDPRRRGARYMVVDHCHSTGRVRQLLCHPCNVALGLLDDSPDRLELAAEYLRKHAA